MKVQIALVSVCMLCACDQRPEYREVDGRALCDPITTKAYVVKPSSGDASFVKRAPQFDSMCRRA